MPDKLSPQQRHTNMAAIKGKDTKPEMVVRRYLWHHGFRYRLNHYRLPGKPDVVLRKYRTCIFVNGCFWHGHNVSVEDLSAYLDKAPSPDSQETSLPLHLDLDSIPNSECCKIPHTNREFWVRKIARNQQRDREVQRKLAQMGWHSITIWECQLKPSCREATLASLCLTLHHIYLQDRQA